MGFAFQEFPPLLHAICKMEFDGLNDEWEDFNERDFEKSKK